MKKVPRVMPNDVNLRGGRDCNMSVVRRLEGKEDEMSDGNRLGSGLGQFKWTIIGKSLILLE